MNFIVIIFLCIAFAYALGLVILNNSEIIAFAYALGLVILNNSEITVQLLFMQAPAMNLGLLLIICIILGIFIGMLLALLMFKVIQNKWELTRLKKENGQLNDQLEEATQKIEGFTQPPKLPASFVEPKNEPKHIKKIDDKDW